jgi:hypothetical protein
MMVENIVDSSYLQCNFHETRHVAVEKEKRGEMRRQEEEEEEEEDDDDDEEGGGEQSHCERGNQLGKKKRHSGMI